MDKLIESYSEFISEKKINPPVGGFKRSEIEKILKSNKDASIYSKSMGQYFYIAPYMHVNGKLENADDEFIVVADKNGRHISIKYSDIDFITV